MRYAMIMAGGSGTRLWPMSTRSVPKQLAPIIQGRSLLQIAAERLDGLVPPNRRYICTGEAHRTAILRDLPSFTSDRILGEPVGRDTLNAVGFTAAVLRELDPDAVFSVFTADHLIEPADVFRDRVDLAYRLVEQQPNRLVTFSIKPTFPATGFGYVQRGDPIDIDSGTGLAFTVKRYVEKPDLETAQSYIESGDFGWNSGMFVWRADTLLRAIQEFNPKSYDGLMRIAKAWPTPDRERVLCEIYPTLPKVSIDYAIMEPASVSDSFEVSTVVTDVSWRDVGSWPSFGETLDSSKRGVRTSCAPGAGAIQLDSRDTLIVNNQPGHTVAVLGVQGLIVVHTESATLVMPADQAERLKELHAQLPDALK